MDFFGWTLSQRLFMGDSKWIMAMDLVDDLEDGELEPDENGWGRLFKKLQFVLHESGLDKNFGSCFHFTPEIAPLLVNLGLVEKFMKARSVFSYQMPFDLGFHAHHQDDDLVNTPRFPDVFRDDIQHAAMFNASILVEHPPVGTQDTIKDTVDVLTSDWFCRVMETHPSITIAWENKADYARNRRFFGSIEKMVEFRNLLRDKLNEVGKQLLIERHRFCFDTGHLLIWRGTTGSTAIADKEIERWLPEFAQDIIAYHFQVNDGMIDGHVTPFSTAFFDHPSRTRMDLEKVIANFDVLRDWIGVCNETQHPSRQHWYLEAGTLPFSLAQYIEFGTELANILKM